MRGWGPMTGEGGTLTPAVALALVLKLDKILRPVRSSVLPSSLLTCLRLLSRRSFLGRASFPLHAPPAPPAHATRLPHRCTIR